MSKLEHDIQAFCDKAIEAKDLSDMHNDMKELLQKEFQVIIAEADARLVLLV